MSSIQNWDEYLLKKKTEFLDNLLLEPDSSVSMNDFKLLETLGTGTFGTVVLARNLNNSEYCAIKILEKTLVVKLNQDNANLFFVMPFIIGGELFFYLRKKGKLDEHLSAFYASQIVLALEYLHYLDIVYRDLKPENVLIDKTGYLKVTDLGFAKIVTTRTYTLCGTPDYIAPEVILSKGYSQSVDWWGLGVLIYEMVAGYPPFYASDTMKTYELIVSGRYPMVQTFSKGLKHLISNLLKVDTTQRIGGLNSGVDDIKNHQWFCNITWLDIANQKVKPPFIPVVSGPDDTSYFEERVVISMTESPEELYKEEFIDF